MEPKTIFITGGSGLVGSHAVEEALARGHRVRTLVRPTSDTRWLEARGVERVSVIWKIPIPCGAGLPGPTGCSTARPRWATGAPLRSSGP